MGKRKRRGKPKSGVRITGYTPGGDPICVDRNGKITVGRGCIEQEVDDAGDVHVTISKKYCPLPVYRALTEKFKPALIKGGRTIYHFPSEK